MRTYIIHAYSANTRYMYGLLFSLSVLLSHSGIAQAEHQWKQVMTIEQEVDACQLDPLNNLILVRKGELTKLDEKGNEVARYSNKAMQNARLDVSNPMKLLLFSSEQMQLIFLDNRLGEMQPSINVFDLGYAQSALAATSHSNGFWMYDPINFVLVRHSQTSDVERKSLNLAQLLKVELLPTDLVETNRMVYLADSANGVFEFDVFGNYLRKIPMLGVKYLCVNNDRLFYEQKGELIAFDLRTSEVERVRLPDMPDFIDFHVNRDRIALRTNKGIVVYAAQ